MTVNTTVPVLLFAYARPDHLRRTLACLRENRVPLIYAFSDGPRTPDKAPLVAQVREILRGIDWCEMMLVEREVNLGLGRSILTGVNEVLQQHEMCIVFEDDLICVPGTYAYLAAALHHYKDDLRVMSVTGWTHPAVTPPDVGDRPYFDGRAECWVWGTWRRAWQGMMEHDARTLMLACEAKGIDRNKYGSDLPAMAEVELQKNIWAVRWLYHHMVHGGLCLRPPWSMVEHIGFDAQATNAKDGSKWTNPPLRPCPPIPSVWPDVQEHPECGRLHRLAVSPQHVINAPSRITMKTRVKRELRRMLVNITGDKRFETVTFRNLIKLFIPPIVLDGYRALRYGRQRHRTSQGENHLTGDYSSWQDALAASSGYDSEIILEKTKAALLKVKNNEAAFERDSVLFDEIQYAWPVLAGLMWVAARSSGRLNVLDFGGSLGSTYFQNRAFLVGLCDVRWNIVEQAQHVEAGKRWFEDDRLKFYTSIEECLNETQPQVILLSSVLQYIPEPYSLLDKMSNLTCDYLIVDRTPFWNGPNERLCVQYVPAEIYAASYPSWIFSRQKFHQCLTEHWDVVAEFDDPDWLPAPIEVTYRGLIAIRRKTR
jgi:putative methyltransferase (TIGR04325 family)